MSGVLSTTSFKFNDVPFDVIVDNNDDENKSYFFASKVATALGYRNVRDPIRKHCPKRFVFCDIPRGARFVPPIAGGPDVQPHTVIIPESDVFRLIMRSRIKSAVEFQDYLYDTVLPSLRRYGTYPPPKQQQQQHVPAIGYDIGVHEDRMRHFETLDDEDRKEMRKETLTETNSLKSERQKEIGGMGGRKRQQDIREMEKENTSLIVRSILNDIINTVVDNAYKKQIIKLKEQNHALKEVLTSAK